MYARRTVEDSRTPLNAALGAKAETACMQRRNVATIFIIFLEIGTNECGFRWLSHSAGKYYSLLSVVAASSQPSRTSTCQRGRGDGREPSNEKSKKQSTRHRSIAFLSPLSDFNNRVSFDFAWASSSREPPRGAPDFWDTIHSDLNYTSLVDTKLHSVEISFSIIDYRHLIIISLENKSLLPFLYESHLFTRLRRIGTFPAPCRRLE